MKVISVVFFVLMITLSFRLHFGWIDGFLFGTACLLGVALVNTVFYYENAEKRSDKES